MQAMLADGPHRDGAGLSETFYAQAAVRVPHFAALAACTDAEVVIIIGAGFAGLGTAQGGRTTVKHCPRRSGRGEPCALASRHAAWCSSGLATIASQRFQVMGKVRDLLRR
jgi:hypothetical protein